MHAAYRGRLLDHVEPGDARRARVGLEQGREDPDEGGLAGAVRPEEGDHATLGHRQVDPAQRLGVPERAGDAFDFDDRAHGSCFPSCASFQKDTPSNELRLDRGRELFGERAIGVHQRALVVHLHEEHARHAVVRRGLDDRIQLRQPGLQLDDPILEEPDDPFRWEHAHEREPGLELRELLGRPPQQLRHPVLELGPAVVGDAVDGALRAPTLPDHLLLLDQTPLEQRLDDAVERAVVQADTRVLPSGTHGGGHLVRVHGALGQAGQHGEGERVGAPSGHGVIPPNTRSRVYGSEYECNPLPQEARTPVEWGGRAHRHAPVRHLTWGCVASISDDRGGGSEPTSPERRERAGNKQEMPTLTRATSHSRPSTN